MMMKSALVYGSGGALGKAVVQSLLLNNSYGCVIGVDFVGNQQCTHQIVLSAHDTFQQQEEKILRHCEDTLKGVVKLDVVVCVAGGWRGGNAASQELVQCVDLMLKQSVQTSVISARISSKFLKENGLLLLTGAKAALEGTPGMIGYGLAKAAVLQLTKSLMCDGSGMPQGAKVACILPVTLDTEANRSAMPKADFSSWTPLNVLADKIVEWSTAAGSCESGLYEVETKQGQTAFNLRK